MASCFPAPSGAVGWWPGDGNTLDIAGTNNGVAQGGALTNATGQVGLAFGFNGTNSFIQIPDAVSLKPTNVTVEGWVRFTSLNSAGLGASPAGDQYIVFKKNSRSSTFEGYCLMKTRVGGGDVFAFIVSSASGLNVEVTSSVFINTGTWYHIAGVRGSNFAQLYVNGHLEAQSTVSFAQDYSATPLYFGTSGQANWDHKLAGVLDEVTVYNRALSSNEIASVYAAGSDGKCAGLRITAQSPSQTVASGVNVNLSVTASGTPPLGYQWQRSGTNLVDGSNISGANAPTLALASAQTNDSANYQVIITNTVSAITSTVMVLTVDPALAPPSIVTPPTNQTVSAGVNVSFGVAAAGTSPLRYQWRFNGTNLADGGQFSGTTNAIFAIQYALPANAGNYTVVVTNSSGSVTSSAAVLTVNALTGCLPPPSGMIGWWPGDSNAKDIVGTNNGILQGGALAGTPGVVGPGFNMDGTNGFVQIPNAPELNPTNLSVECWVKFHLMDTPGNSTTGAQYIVFKQNTRSSVFEGYNLSKHRYETDIIVWEASSAGGVAVQINGVTAIQKDVWYHLVGVRDTNALRLYLNGLLEAEAPINFPQDYGNFPLYFGTSNQSYWDHKLGGWLDEVTLYNRALSPGEIAALYASGPAGKCKAPTILTQPQGDTRYVGSTFTFTSSVAGVSPLRYQWQKDGVNLPGATNASLVLTNLQSTNAGGYSLQITNALGQTLSDTAVLQLKMAGLSIAVGGSGNPGAAGLTINGAIGATYGIQSCDALGATNHWLGLTNLTLISTSQVWYDPQPMNLPQRYYRVVPGPIPVP